MGVIGIAMLVAGAYFSGFVMGSTARQEQSLAEAIQDLDGTQIDLDGRRYRVQWVEVTEGDEGLEPCPAALRKLRAS